MPRRVKEIANGRPFKKSGLVRDEEDGDRQTEEQNAQNDRDPEQNAFNAAASRKNRTRIGSGQATEAGSLTLHNDAED